MKLDIEVNILFDYKDGNYKFDGNLFYKLDCGYGYKEVQLEEDVILEFYSKLDKIKNKNLRLEELI